jgi:hypothetical protein
VSDIDLTMTLETIASRLTRIEESLAKIEERWLPTNDPGQLEARRRAVSQSQATLTRIAQQLEWVSQIVEGQRED